MKEILITSSVLIAALLVLRRVFRRSISRRAQYALWGLVLVRLLVPLNLPALDHNVLTAAAPVQTAVTQRLERPQLYSTPVDVSPAAAFPEARNVQPGQLVPTAQSFGYPVLSDDGATVTTYANRLDHPIVPAEILTIVWYAGMALMGVWFLLSNLRFWGKLRRSRTPYAAENCARRVYLVEQGLPSPCLFGLFRPAIYLTPAAVASPESLRHVLAHEETHARHLDPLWSLLRAVCLAVYWFDPLVWAAAIASKNDCELACDEGAIARLGEAERIPYGKTLLSLIPVRRGLSNPLLSATTMTAGKRQLKDRVARIAQSRRTVGIALFAVIALAAVVCAATFTGAADKGPEETDSAAKADGPLTGDELRYFNLKFFNGTDVYDNETMNIRNQFLASTYERPEDVGLLEIFYSGIPYGEIDVEADLSAGWDVLRAMDGWFEPDCPTYALSTAEMDALLLKYIGLTVEETSQTGLQDMGTYLPEYDAYYWAHGDTLYRGQVEITAGEREGDLVRLYYQDYWSGGIGGAWMCATLRELENGGYHFVSNLPCEAPAIPTALPAEEPWRTIPLTDLPDHGVTAMPLVRHSMDCARRGGGHMVNSGYTTGGSPQFSFRPYLSTDGNYYAAIIRDEAAGRDGPLVWEADVFLTISPINSLEWDETTIDIRYMGEIASRYIYELRYMDQEGDYPVSVYDYYYFQEDGAPVLLHRTRNYDNRLFDLNGDGVKELVSAGRDGAEILFQDPDKPDVLHLADVGRLLSGAWPESSYWDYAELDTFDRCLRVRGSVDMPEWGQDTQADFQRAVYFTPENLLVYTNLTDTKDHMAVNIGDSVPQQVRDDALTLAENAYEETRAESNAQAARYDDWRVSALALTGTYADLPVEGTLEVYSVGWQLHAGNPTGVQRAGGIYLQEDGWAGGFNTDASPYLLYRLNRDSSREKVESLLRSGYLADSELYRVDLNRSVVQAGLADMADLESRDLFYMFWNAPYDFLNSLKSIPSLSQQGIFEKIISYAETGPNGEASMMEDVMDTLSSHPPQPQEPGWAAYQRLLALWERPADESVPTAPLLPTPESFSMFPSEVAEAVCRLGQENLAAYLEEPAGYDGWRAPGLTFVSRHRFSSTTPDLPTFDIYMAPVELHPSQPDQVVLAGGMGFTEDGWVKGLMAASPYLVFLAEGDKLTFVESDIPYDLSPDSPGFRAELARVLLENQVILPSQIDHWTLLSMLSTSTLQSLNLLGTFPEEEQEAVLKALDAFHHQGSQEEQLALRDAIQTIAWSQRDLDEHGAALFQKLLDHTGIQPHGITNHRGNHLGSAIDNALLYWRQNASAHEYDHHAIAYYLLDTQEGGCSCTVHLLVSWGDYELTEDGYELSSGGDWNAMAVSFSHVNDRYQATEIWEPHGGGLYEPEIRACFPKESADIVFSSEGLKYEAIREALDNYLEMDVEAWYKSVS